jgi:general nucleoside transport system permease protein
MKRIGTTLALNGAALLAAFAFAALLVLLVGSDPAEVAGTLWQGAFGSARSLSNVVNFWLPLALACLGLAITFSAGLWNIGIEGQIMAGAIGASAVVLFPPALDTPLVIALSLLMAATAGAAWALLVGLLRTRLGVHEIFGGTALNALINVLSIYLISGPWQPSEGGSAQGTDPFAAVLRLTPLSPEFAVNPVMLLIVAAAIPLVVLALNGTRWGLQLKATGKNRRSALLLGVPVERSMVTALIACGALAGLAGAYRVLFSYGNLRPLASGGIGFLALLVVLLAGMRAIWTPLIAFAFAAILTGSNQVKLMLQLDTSLAGVLQGALVLASLFAQGVRERFNRSP